MKRFSCLVFVCAAALWMASCQTAVRITSPADNAVFSYGEEIPFAADTGDADISSLVWSSSIDGELGTGTPLTTTALSVGVHTITLTATLADASVLTDGISITVTAPIADDDDPADPPDSTPVAYDGTLTVHLTNTFPAFDASTQIDVEIYTDDSVVFGTGTLQYAGEDEIAGQSKTKREGTLSIAPLGRVQVSGGISYLQVDENTTYTDTMTMWVWDGSEWILYPGMPIESTGEWHAGLSFVVQDAVVDTSVAESATGMGSVSWTLQLTPARIP